MEWGEHQLVNVATADWRYGSTLGDVLEIPTLGVHLNYGRSAMIAYIEGALSMT